MIALAQQLYSIITHTPVWVWLVLGFLLYRGIKGLKTTAMSIRSLFILPAIFLISGLTDLLTTHSMPLFGYGTWLAGFAIGIGIGQLLARRTKFVIDKKNETITLPGSAQLLTLILLIFCIKYSFGYMATVHPDITQTNTLYIAFKTSLNSLITGIFIGRVLFFWHSLKQ